MLAALSCIDRICHHQGLVLTSLRCSLYIGTVLSDKQHQSKICVFYKNMKLKYRNKLDVLFLFIRERSRVCHLFRAKNRYPSPIVLFTKLRQIGTLRVSGHLGLLATPLKKISVSHYLYKKYLIVSLLIQHFSFLQLMLYILELANDLNFCIISKNIMIIIIILFKVCGWLGIHH
jgi:hypothetical protein